MRKELHTRGIFTEPLSLNPVKFRTYIVPEYVTATAYFIDNNGAVVTNDNFKKFKTWSVELVLRFNKSSVETVKTTVLGAHTYTGHNVFSFGVKFDPTKYGSVQGRHYEILKERRSELVGYAVEVLIARTPYKKTSKGGHSWTLGERSSVDDAELLALRKSVIDEAFTKTDENFYKEVARVYNEAVANGQRPIKELIALTGKADKTCQAYVAECRKRRLLAKTKPGKVSQPIKTRKGKVGK